MREDARTGGQAACPNRAPDTWARPNLRISCPFARPHTCSDLHVSDPSGPNRTKARASTEAFGPVRFVRREMRR